MNITLQVWRQEGPDTPGRFITYQVNDISDEMSFLEMLDVLNERLVNQGEEPVAFDHDCREGICGTCGVMINGRAHGPQAGTATCQLHMRQFADGAELVVEPWRATGFPIIKDLVVDRSAFDRIVEAGGYISVRTGAAPDANAIPDLRPQFASDPEGFAANSAMVWGAQPYKGHIFFSDFNSGLWSVRLEPKSKPAT